jgi:hypothetical protein
VLVGSSQGVAAAAPDCGRGVSTNHLTIIAPSAVAKDADENALKFISVDYVDDEVDRGVERHHEVGDLSQWRDGNRH